MTLHRHLGGIEGASVVATLWRVLVALVPTAAVALGVDRAIGSGTVVTAGTDLVVAAIAASAVYALILHLLGIPIIRMFVDILRPSGRATPADA